ncbi:MAG: hypothetical protein ACR2KK_11035, partial [Acidimicrobiales bacterium]
FTTIGSPLMRGAAVGATENLIGGGVSRAAYGENPFDPRGMAGDLLLGGGIGGGASRLARTPASRAVAEGAEIKTPYGVAAQADDAASLALRSQAEAGADMYRQGAFGVQETGAGSTCHDDSEGAFE